MLENIHMAYKPYERIIPNICTRNPRTRSVPTPLPALIVNDRYSYPHHNLVFYSPKSCSRVTSTDHRVLRLALELAVCVPL